MKKLVLSLALCSSAAFGQSLGGGGFIPGPPGPPGVTPDLSALATKAEVAAVASTVPVPYTSPPPMETVDGAAGTPGTYRPGPAIQPRITRSVSGTTASNGQAIVAWQAMATVPKLVLTPYVGSADTQVPACYPVDGTVTTTGATIKCFKTQTLLGLGLAPFATATAGIKFDVLAIPGS